MSWRVRTMDDGSLVAVVAVTFVGFVIALVVLIK